MLQGCVNLGIAETPVHLGAVETVVVLSYGRQWRIGVGVTIQKHLYGAIFGAVGICDQAQDKAKMRSNLFDITLGYNF